MSKHRAGATRSRSTAEGTSAPTGTFPGGAPDSDLSFYQLSEKYPDEQSAIAYFTAHRWPDGITCPKWTQRGTSTHKRTGKARVAPTAAPAVNVNAQVEAARAVLAKHGAPEERKAVAGAKDKRGKGAGK